MLRNSVIVLILFFFIIGCERMETSESVYPNFEAAIKAKAVGEGKWVPDFLPPSSTNIREKHNLDTNEQWLSFHFTGDIASHISLCKQTIMQEIVYPRRSPGNWWPQTLLQNSANQESKNYVYYTCRENNFVGNMAINFKKSDGYYWLLKLY